MLEDQPLDLSVRVGDYAEKDVINGVHGQHELSSSNDGADAEYGIPTSLRLRGCFTSGIVEYRLHDKEEDRSDDSDDSFSDNKSKDDGGVSDGCCGGGGDDGVDGASAGCVIGGGGSARSRSRPPGTKPYKKNLMRRYREFLLFDRCIYMLFSPLALRSTKNTIVALGNTKNIQIIPYSETSLESN